MIAYEVLTFYTNLLGLTPEYIRQYVPTTSLRVYVSESVQETIDAVPTLARACMAHERVILITLDKDLRSFNEEFDLLALLQPLTAYNTLISHIEQLEIKFSAAISMCISENRPVHLQIPENILISDIPEPKLWARFCTDATAQAAK
jgi:thiamine pyrophosphate-dependent acetolactate synthase large subunit-like protein